MANNKDDIGRRLLGMSAVVSEGNELIDVDVEGLIRRLLLFDHYILNSIRLQEFPILARRLGFEGLRDLLSAQLITVRCECLQTVEIGNTGLFRDPPLPLLTFKFNWIDMSDREKYTHDCLQAMHEVRGLWQKDAIKLKRLIAHSIVPLAKETKQELMPSFSEGFMNEKLVIAAVNLVLQKKLAKTPDAPYRIEISQRDGDGIFTANTNLGQVTGLAPAEVHQAIQSALLGIASTNQVIGEMKAYKALSGFRQDELPLFNKKLDFLAERCSGETLERNFGRIIDISGIPSLQDEGTIFDVERLLRVRESTETIEFKSWLQSGACENESEITERVLGFRGQAGLKLSSFSGKATRFFITTAIGMLPDPHAQAIAFGLGVIDTFLLEKIFPRSGITAFVNELYPSIFENRKRN